jgi:N utilization substance protein A
MAQLTGTAATPLESVEGLGEGLVEKLKAAGIATVEALADMTPEQLEAIEGIGPKTVEKISVAVNNYFSSLEGGETVQLPENEGEEVATQTEGVEELESEASNAVLSSEAGSSEAEAQPESDESQTAADSTPEDTASTEQKE